MDAVEIALRSLIISHLSKALANRSRVSIIFSLSGRNRLVTAMSISLDSKARPVTRDPNYFILGTNFFPSLLLALFGERLDFYELSGDLASSSIF